ncbi:cytochrome P450 [Frankia sp. CNm7]|uniref:Cytochrome P450 n=1 Tax=Frankia nepalensis TaxID=1836974 RepID=A0A937RP35_9ACTN|nr:cytochrome P450 [Frankia nepalensis]MBL7499670.1 cytochrome P450 [Frankia nepalensis]MBL7514642.1 cytochrome P450 [Frankia nepalensis]MBL7522611.1 cytochrome P450 [Frankia nepalensis]MBL7629396.1 cytochrome P450 [Frankia nepalensis]
MSTISAARFDDPFFYLDDPNAVFAELRRTDPVHWYDDGRFWVVTKYDDIRSISTHPEQFTSSRIAILMDLVARRDGAEPFNVAGSSHRGIMFMDPPEHIAHRKAVSVRFTPRAVAGVEEHVRSVVRDVLARLPTEPFDWIEHVAEPIPVFVFSRLLGIPEEDWPKVSGWATTIARVGSGDASPEDADTIYTEIGPYLLDLTLQRRERPTGDLLTMLTTVSVDGVPFDEIQVLTYALTLLAAGSETTQSLIAGLAYCFNQHPEQAARVFADPALAAGAVEETLRWWTPVMSMARESASDVDLRGSIIRANDGVLLAYASANRDEEKWGPTAEEFDVTRTNAANHLGFGIGEHFCMGAALARREARVLVEELAARAGGIQIEGDPTPRASSLVHTFDHLLVRLVDQH